MRKYNRAAPTSFPGSLLSASLSRWNRDPGCDWSRDHLSIQNRRVGGYSGRFGREDDKIPPCCPPFQQIFLPPRFWVVTWTLSVPTTKGGREERPWKRGWCCTCGTHISTILWRSLSNDNVKFPNLKYERLCDYLLQRRFYQSICSVLCLQ